MPVILHVDPSSTDREHIRDALSSQENWDVEGAASFEEARERLQLHPVDLILSEIDIGDGEWRDLLTFVRSRQWGTSLFIVSSQLNIDLAAQAVKDGAEGVITKGSDPSEWIFPLECAIERAASRVLRQAAESGLSHLTMRFQLENEKGRVPHLVTLLVEHCDRFGLLDDRDRMRIQVALEEALLNSIIHGNLEVSSRLRELEGDVFEQAISSRKEQEPYRSRRVTLVASFSHAEAKFVIRDEGPGFDVNSVKNPTEDDAITLASGRGILLMRSFMDELDYNDRGNEVTMRKLRSASLAPNPHNSSMACDAVTE